ncbi:hypothetical protein HK096_006060 [Nowakowskiella sp. JEL0078]|nr:hypothetical protein HK096_006060 [Nowakowskiella sp. JEL0078]
MKKVVVMWKQSGVFKEDLLNSILLNYFADIPNSSAIYSPAPVLTSQGVSDPRLRNDNNNYQQSPTIVTNNSDVLKSSSIVDSSILSTLSTFNQMQQVAVVAGLSNLSNINGIAALLPLLQQSNSQSDISSLGSFLSMTPNAGVMKNSPGTNIIGLDTSSNGIKDDFNYDDDDQPYETNYQKQKNTTPSNALLGAISNSNVSAVDPASVLGIANLSDSLGVHFPWLSSTVSSESKNENNSIQANPPTFNNYTTNNNFDYQLENGNGNDWDQKQGFERKESRNEFRKNQDIEEIPGPTCEPPKPDPSAPADTMRST